MNDINNKIISYEKARSSLLLLAVFSALNMIIILAKSSTSVLFSAVIPQLSVLYGMKLGELNNATVYNLLGYTVALAVIGLYVVTYYKAKKDSRYLIVALVMLAVDFIALAYWMYLGLMIDDILCIAVHIIELIYLVAGIKASKNETVRKYLEK